MTLTICIGSSCHLKGSKQVAKTFERLINEHNLKDQINFYATFCMGNCQKGVCVTVDNEFFSVTPDTVADFFQKNVKEKV